MLPTEYFLDARVELNTRAVTGNLNYTFIHFTTSSHSIAAEVCDVITSPVEKNI